MIKLHLTYNPNEIKCILSNPDIWERFSDGAELDGFEPMVGGNHQWLIVERDGAVIGIIYLIVETSCAVGIHPYLFKPERWHGREMMRAFYCWFLDNVNQECVKINATIPTCYQSAINFARKVGFVDEGVSRLSYRKGGKLFDRVILGITRGEVEVCLA